MGTGGPAPKKAKIRKYVIFACISRHRGAPAHTHARAQVHIPSYLLMPYAPFRASLSLVLIGLASRVLDCSLCRLRCLLLMILIGLYPESWIDYFFRILLLPDLALTARQILLRPTLQYQISLDNGTEKSCLRHLVASHVRAHNSRKPARDFSHALLGLRAGRGPCAADDLSRPAAFGHARLSATCRCFCFVSYPFMFIRIHICIDKQRTKTNTYTTGNDISENSPHPKPHREYQHTINEYHGNKPTTLCMYARTPNACPSPTQARNTIHIYTYKHRIMR